MDRDELIGALRSVRDAAGANGANWQAAVRAVRAQQLMSTDGRQAIANNSYTRMDLNNDERISAEEIAAWAIAAGTRLDTNAVDFYDPAVRLQAELEYAKHDCSCEVRR